jgi:mRNA interferase RelE/StbE
MGSYNLFFKVSAKKELRQVPPPFIQKILSKIETLSSEPRPFGVKLLKGESRYYRIRQGDYRIVYEVDDALHTVTVITIGHRREVYQGL